MCVEVLLLCLLARGRNGRVESEESAVRHEKLLCFLQTSRLKLSSLARSAYHSLIPSIVGAPYFLTHLTMDNLVPILGHLLPDEGEIFAVDDEVARPPALQAEMANSATTSTYDFVFKFLLLGDPDTGKEEILAMLEDTGDDETAENYRSLDVAYKSTSILLFGKRVKLHIWNTSGQGRFSTVFNTYSRGTQGVILCYDITNKFSFNGLDRWIREIDKHAPGVPKILIGNRKHLAFRRQISEKQAKSYATKHNMAFLEVSPLCNFNVQESCAELTRLVLERNGMNRADFWNWNPSKTLPSLQELCYRRIISEVNSQSDIENLPLPPSIKSYLKSFSPVIMSNYSFENQLETLKKEKSKRKSLSVRCSKLLSNLKNGRSDKSSSPQQQQRNEISPTGKSLRRLFSVGSPSSNQATSLPTSTTTNSSSLSSTSPRKGNSRKSCVIS